MNQRGIEYRYRDYRKAPLSAPEIRGILELLGLPASAVLRRRDAAARALGLGGDEDDATLVRHMAEHPTLLQRPIAILAGRAVVGRPIERILSLLPEPDPGPRR